jgi:hypothetical protein
LDRLGRSVRNLIDLVETLRERLNRVLILQTAFVQLGWTVETQLGLITARFDRHRSPKGLRRDRALASRFHRI